MKIRGQILKLMAEALNSTLGTPKVDHSILKELYRRPPNKGIRHTLCGSRSMARWEHHKERGYHNIFPYAFLNKESCVWLRIVRACLILGSHFTKISRDRVCRVFALMTDTPIIIGAVIRAFMRKARL